MFVDFFQQRGVVTAVAKPEDMTTREADRARAEAAVCRGAFGPMPRQVLRRRERVHGKSPIRTRAEHVRHTRRRGVDSPLDLRGLRLRNALVLFSSVIVQSVQSVRHVVCHIRI